MIFLASEIRRDGLYGIRFEADNWPDAQKHCEDACLVFDGLFMFEMKGISDEIATGIISEMAEKENQTIH